MNPARRVNIRAVTKIQANDNFNMWKVRKCKLAD